MEAYERLEYEWGKVIGNPNCVACSSGTSALHLALEAFQFSTKYHHEVFVPEFTMVACARAVTLAGLECKFIDCNERLLMDVEQLRKHVTLGPVSPVAIMPVHVYGRRCDMDTIHEVAKLRKLVVIEDLAEAHGIQPHPETDAACWSFYKNKIIAGEEGGMITFKDPKLAERARALRSLGFTKDHNFTHIPRGINARLSNLHAEKILSSLYASHANNRLRKKVIKQYDKYIPEAWHMPERDAPWVYDIRIPGLKTEEQDLIITLLNDQGIPARHGFKPMSDQPEYQRYTPCDLLARRLSREVLYLPVTPLVQYEEVQWISDALLVAVQDTAPSAVCSV